MREHHISVGPVIGGWEVRCDGAMHPLMFLSGRCAEQHARTLAQALSREGDAAMVAIHDRSTALVGAVRYEASAHRQPLPA